MKNLNDYRNKIISIDVTYDIFYKLRNPDKYLAYEEKVFHLSLFESVDPSSLLQMFNSFEHFCHAIKIGGWRIV